MGRRLVLTLLVTFVDLLACVAHRKRLGAADSLPKVGAKILSPDDASGFVSASGKRSRKYLIASFPRLKQVAYCMPPDNVWRPLVLGDVSEPTGIAVDMVNARLYVSDPPNHVIWLYVLNSRSDGQLETAAKRRPAAQGVIAKFLTVNGVGDLYFTGHLASESNHSSVFKQDAANIAAGRSTAPTELFSRSNTGSPDPKAWEPSGVVVDSLFVYWGNGEKGDSHGSVVKASRVVAGASPGGQGQERQLKPLSMVAPEVRGMTTTGTHVFYTSSLGVHGVLKSSSAPVTDPLHGRVASRPAAGGPAVDWDPDDIAWDGDNTLYLTDSKHGIVYSLPAHDTLEHNVTKFTEAPGAHAITVVRFAPSQVDRPTLLGPTLLGAEGSARGAMPAVCLLLLGFLITAM